MAETNTGWKVAILNGICDRCGKEAPELHPWRWTEQITYRGKTIKRPWLCVKCIIREKEKRNE